MHAARGILILKHRGVQVGIRWFSSRFCPVLPTYNERVLVANARLLKMWLIQLEWSFSFSG
jgi:hypothetical protein